MTFSFSIPPCLSTQIPPESPKSVILQGGFAFSLFDTRNSWPFEGFRANPLANNLDDEQRGGIEASENQVHSSLPSGKHVGIEGTEVARILREADIF